MKWRRRRFWGTSITLAIMLGAPASAGLSRAASSASTGERTSGDTIITDQEGELERFISDVAEWADEHSVGVLPFVTIDGPTDPSVTRLGLAAATEVAREIQRSTRGTALPPAEIERELSALGIPLKTLHEWDDVKAFGPLLGVDGVIFGVIERRATPGARGLGNSVQLNITVRMANMVGGRDFGADLVLRSGNARNASAFGLSRAAQSRWLAGSWIDDPGVLADPGDMGEAMARAARMVSRRPPFSRGGVAEDELLCVVGFDQTSSTSAERSLEEDRARLAAALLAWEQARSEGGSDPVLSVEWSLDPKRFAPGDAAGSPPDRARAVLHRAESLAMPTERDTLLADLVSNLRREVSVGRITTVAEMGDDPGLHPGSLTPHDQIMGGCGAYADRGVRYLLLPKFEREGGRGSASRLRLTVLDLADLERLSMSTAWVALGSLAGVPD